jgi:AbrB family looped-hinge helix DNA binding protein
MTAITVSSKYQIVIPKEARERLKITPGTRLLVTQDKHGVHLVKEPTLEEVRGMLDGIAWVESEVRDESERQLS